MELPSMVERSGDKLIVRSVVSGNALYMDQGGDGTQHAPGSSSRSSNVAPTSALQEHFEYERYSLAAQQQRLEQHKKLQEQQQQQKQKQTFAQQLEATIELKDEELPQCKIKRNYSCRYCHHYTQNPRCHLTHMRDVHGENITINKCNLCLYASRHFQKVVRHMKMVHGCKEDIPTQRGQTRRTSINREARKRKLEQSATDASTGTVNSQQQQEEKPRQQQRLQQSEVEAFFNAAYKHELQLQRKHVVGTKQQGSSTTAVAVADFQAGLPVNSHKDQEPVQKRLLKCSVCGFMTLYHSQLIDHRAKEHCQIKFFSCEKCAYVTHIKARFSKHVKYHTMPMVECVLCDFRTPYKWNLDRHMKNHGGDGPFKCPACDFTADIKQSLTVHEMNHHVPSVGRPAGVSLVRRHNKVGGTDFPNDLTDSADLLEDQFKNNSIDDDEDALTEIEAYGKRSKYDDEEPTDLQQKSGSSDTFSVHGQSPNASSVTSKSTMPMQDPIPKTNSGLNLSKYLSESRSCLIDIGVMFFDEEELTEILQEFDKSNTAQMLPTTAITSTVNRNARSPLQQKLQSGGDDGCNFFDKLNQSPPGGLNESIICPVENRFLGWNKRDMGNDDTVEVKEENSQRSGNGAADNGSCGHNDNNSYYGVETAPGYGEVIEKMTPEKEGSDSSLKTVYKCPHCTFWASNASRFHVHIVGHLNKKPFECSLCHYRSNWPWDITKHIRLKAIRDPNYKTARVLAYDDTGRRNYSKYTKYMTLMKVSENNGDPKLIKSGEMTPDQVASSTLLNDYKKNTSPNGIKDIVTLGPIAATTTPPKPTKTAALESGGDAHIADTFMNLPSIATAMTNAATMAQQQEQEQQQVALITPSGTISAVKQSPSVSTGGAQTKRSCDLTTEVRQEGNERKMFYKCRKCNFRHENRDAVLSHINIHYQDDPVVTATATSSSSESTQHTNVSVALSPNGATQQQSSHSMLSTGLLQEGIGGASATAAVTTLPSANSTLTSASCTLDSLEASSSLLASSSRSGGGVCIDDVTTSTPTTSSNLELKSTTANAATASSTRLDCINLLANKNQRPEPSLYRCGHCHQLSNWKHVIQRHCRLKHDNEMRVEALDRGNNTTTEQHVAPVYRLLDMNAYNESDNFRLSTKAQQQQIIASNSVNIPKSDNSNINKSNSNKHNNNNNNSINKDVVDQSSHSALATNSINAMQQYREAAAIVAYLAEAYIAATAKASAGTSGQNAVSTENLLLHQQLRPNEQVEITRLPSNKSKTAESNDAASINSERQQQATATASNGSLSSLDFSAALQFAAAAQTQQHPTSLLQTLLSVDFSALKSLTDASGSSFLQKQQQQQHQQLSNELQPYKTVSYCSKCPARFPQKLHDIINFNDFQNHLKAHRSAEQADYRCEFCDFMASHETKLQSHGFVHTSRYQEKCNELIRNCKEDPEHPAPKLKQVAFNKLEDAQTQPAMIWVVDNELSEQLKQKQQQQNSSISSSSTSAPYDNTNSLLKKQLESGPAPISTLTRISSTTRGYGYPSAAPSTNASVAASDLAADVGRDCGSVAASPAPLKKCLHCPYVTTSAESYKAHLQHHTCISQVKEAYSCEHCDYTDAIEGHIVEHVRLHLKAMKKLKKVALLTSNDQLELSKDRVDVNAANIEGQAKDETSKGEKSNGADRIKSQHRIKKAQNSSNKKVVANENTLQGMRDKVRNDASTTVTKKGVPRKRKAVTAAIKATVSAPAPLPTGSATQCHQATKGCPKIAYKDDGCRGVKRDLGGRPVCSSSGERENIGARIRTNITRSSAIQPWSQQRNQKTILVNAKTGQVIRRN